MKEQELLGQRRQGRCPDRGRVRRAHTVGQDSKGVEPDEQDRGDKRLHLGQYKRLHLETLWRQNQ